MPTEMNKVALLLAMAGLAACASNEPPRDRQPDSDLAVVREALDCPADEALVCMKRYDRRTGCHCAGRDSLEKYLELPEKY